MAGIVDLSSEEIQTPANDVQGKLVSRETHEMAAYKETVGKRKHDHLPENCLEFTGEKDCAGDRYYRVKKPFILVKKAMEWDKSLVYRKWGVLVFLEAQPDTVIQRKKEYFRKGWSYAWRLPVAKVVGVLATRDHDARYYDQVNYDIRTEKARSVVDRRIAYRVGELVRPNSYQTDTRYIGYDGIWACMDLQGAKAASWSWEVITGYRKPFTWTK